MIKINEFALHDMATQDFDLTFIWFEPIIKNLKKRKERMSVWGEKRPNASVLN